MLERQSRKPPKKKTMTKVDDIKKIREITGVSIEAVSKALEEADGKIGPALEILKKRGAQVARKIAGRETGEGLIFSYVHGNGKIGVLIKMLCETDFVARNHEFQELGHELAMQVAAMNPADVDELLAQRYVRDEDLTVDILIKNYIGKLGENIKVSEFCRFEI